MSFRIATRSQRQLTSLFSLTYLPPVSAASAIRRVVLIRSHLSPSFSESSSSTKSVRAMASSSSPSLPTTMKGVIIDKTGGSEVLQYVTDLPVPRPADGEVLIKNDFIGVNFIDTYFRTGLYPAPSFPYILGRESSGTIIALGPGDEYYGLSVGDNVAVSAEKTYAEYTVAPAKKTAKIPDGLDAKTAAAALTQGLTALTLIRESHHVKKGDWVLVHAAAGGTGLWLCQLLRAVGANTIGTASTEEKVQLAKANGATHVINYGSGQEDVKAKVLELTDGKGCVAIFDGVGKATFDLSMECVARLGSMISFGNASGAVPPLTIAKLSAKNVRLMRPTLFNYVVTQKEFAGWVDELFKFLSADNGAGQKVNVNIHKVYPLSEVAKAHDDLESRVTTGKLLLDPSK